MALKTLTALSGGVDSSVAAYLLKEDGLSPSAVFMRHPYQAALDAEGSERFWAESSENKNIPVRGVSSAPEGREVFWTPELFPFPRDACDALRVARALEIPFFLYDAAPLFRRVVDDWSEEYLAGRTPNPCVLCNRILKFGELIDLARRFGFDRFATGHYIKRVTRAEWLRAGLSTDALPDWLADESPETPVLLRGGDPQKDQSYVLYAVERARLATIRFPLSDLEKPQVRQIAAETRLPVAKKRESQDLCFVGDESPAAFLRKIAGPLDTAGNFVSRHGEVLGRHLGYEKYTVGQRKGLGIGFGERTFVQRIVPSRKEVVLGSRDDLASTLVTASGANWLAPIPIGVPFRAEVKIRYRSVAVGAELTAQSDGTVTARLDEPRYGIAPGQSLVCYWKNRLIGGGVITEQRPEHH